MSYLENLEEFNRTFDAATRKISPVSVIGVSESARADFIYSICKKLGKKPFVILPNSFDARIFKEDLEFYMPDGCELYQSKDYIFHNIETAAKSISNSRIRTAMNISAGCAGAVIAPVEAILQYTLPPESAKENSITVTVGKPLIFDVLKKRLIQMGYTNSDAVEGVGQISVKGGIIDVFTPTEDMPVRIEFWGDEVDTIRYFDPETQVSTDNINNCTICPCRETLYDDVEPIVRKIQTYPQTAWTQADIDLFRNDHYFPATDRYLPLIYKNISTILDYLTDEYIIFLCSPAVLQEKAEQSASDICSNLAQFAENDTLPMFKGSYTADLHEIFKNTKNQIISVDNLYQSAGFLTIRGQFNIQSRNLQSYEGRLDLIIDDVKYWQKKKYAITILAGSEIKSKAFARSLTDNNIPCICRNDGSFAKHGETIIIPGSISRGFEYPLLDTVVMSSREIFGAAKHRRKSASMPGTRLKSFSDLSEGDYVVHQVHGIGKYIGIQRMEVDGTLRDYLKIQYKGSDVLYVPATSLDTVNKYISGETKDLKLNKMGGAEFAKVKARVKKSLEDIADDLIALYAKRSSQKGYAFSPDNDWQKNFEEQFPYDETPDQLRCIDEVKQDMESEQPMERLLCGDVGFGKTEVALRAAFKAVMDSKQVAYLVPTTILAQQHYGTFLQRMKDFPITVEVLSRFRTPKQQKDVVKRLASGEVDIVIGTHRILQDDMVFKDLGLLIIDEEQRFGVKHKEKIKELKTNIDVLSLSATPIPRTLHMSLTGIRDMSVISMPPEDRYPVQTYISEYDKEIVRDAIAKELGRNGQVYYVYNRIDTIYKAANELQQLVPNARIGVGHGRMSERELENIMMQTLAGEIDVLVCTTIIETGLDIPNINTIIIENADCMGLSQLYQLRGRVGRSNRLAYAYLMYRKDKVLAEIATKRLTAIREFTEFGSGFKIAMRDLEIRGAGDLLGAKQHGEMDAVGYDMYCKLLDMAVSEAKGETVKEETVTNVDIKIDTYIPDEYIGSHNVRIEMYKKIAAVESEDDRDTVIDEIVDRFGAPPDSVVNLLEVSLIRVYAGKAGITDVVEQNGRIYMMFEREPDREKINAVVSTYRGQLLYSTGGKPRLTYIDSAPQIGVVLRNLKALLNYYNSYETE